MIEYSLPASGHVTVSVFDKLGDPVKTLVDDEQHAGIHRTPFHADGLPTGVYYYRVKTSGFLQTKRMLLLK